MSRRSPKRLKRGLPDFFICFQAGSGSMAMMPSAIERQRRKATRKSCTGSGAKSTLARSHSSRAAFIQKAKPIFFTGFAFTDFWFAGLALMAMASGRAEAEDERDFASEDML